MTCLFANARAILRLLTNVNVTQTPQTAEFSKIKATAVHIPIILNKPVIPNTVDNKKWKSSCGNLSREAQENTVATEVRKRCPFEVTRHARAN